MKSIRALPLVLASWCMAVPACAQDGDPSAEPEITVDESVFDGDFAIVGLGAMLLPSYDGSDDMIFAPAGAVAGRIAGIRIAPRSAGIALDLIPDDSNTEIGLIAGPVIRYRANRTTGITDPVVAQLGKLPGAIEAGPFAGVTIKGVLNDYDQLTFASDFRWDISGNEGGFIAVPGVSYLTPLSRADIFGFSASVSFVDDEYARYNFSVTPAGAAASGLPAYDAQGGFKDWTLVAYYGHDLDGDLNNGGFSIGAGMMYAKLYGSAAESPITSIRGSRDQWYFGTGLAYVF